MAKTKSCIATVCLCCLLLTGCSGGKDAEQGKASDRSATERTADAIKQYGAKPIDKARSVQQLGDQRTKAMDEAVRSK